MRASGDSLNTDKARAVRSTEGGVRANAGSVRLAPRAGRGATGEGLQTNA